jgi:drug/metabolite transporter (DMT)-like permease
MADEVASTAPAGRVDAPALVAGLMTVTAWGSAFVAIRAADQALSPGALALGRLVVSTAILGGVALVRREPPPGRRDLLAIAVYAGRTASLNYLIPVVAIVLGWAALGETPPRLAMAGGALCLLGVYLARRGAGARSP